MSAPHPAGMSPWQRRLGDQLVAAAGRLNHRRRRRRRLGAAVAVVAVVSAGLAGIPWLTDTDPAAAAIHIETLPNGDLALTLAVGAQLDDAVAILCDAGFDVALETTPTGPSRVGEVTSLSAPAGAGDQVVVDGDDPPTITLAYGVLAAPGETYLAPTDPWAEGEPLEGIDVDRDDPAAVVRTAHGLGLTTRIQSPGDGQPLSDLPPRAEALFYLMLGPDLLLVQLAP